MRTATFWLSLEMAYFPSEYHALHAHGGGWAVQDASVGLDTMTVSGPPCPYIHVHMLRYSLQERLGTEAVTITCIGSRRISVHLAKYPVRAFSLLRRHLTLRLGRLRGVCGSKGDMYHSRST